MNSSEEKFFGIIEEIDELGNIICAIRNAYDVFKDFESFNEKTFISTVNEYLLECSFDPLDTEIIRDYLIYHMKLNSYDFYNILEKHTDYTTSEIREIARDHCDFYGIEYQYDELDITWDRDAHFPEDC